jgi:hypothetical protein
MGNREWGVGNKDFNFGFIVGFITAVIILAIIFAFHSLIIRERTYKKELIEYAEKQIEIEEMRENIINCDPYEFLEIPDVRRAADGAAAEFERKRDEILQRFRNRLAY